MSKYEEYDKTYDDDQLAEIIQNYNDSIDVVENDEKMIKELEDKSKRTAQEDEKLKQLKETLQKDLLDLQTWDEDSKIAEQI